ncbi:hypothetical protein U1737_19020 [Sphingomonas sp. LB3N6]|uniref:hypothetical protein n=1 Tax=Sphingomonas fucosidasi TaxID=3096164 RepID=UPI002FCA3D9A
MLVALALATAHASAGNPPSAPALTGNISTDIMFRPVSATTATLTIRSAGSPQAIEIKRLDDTLALLADKRLAAIWPQVTEWAGMGLEKLRDSAIGAAQVLFAKGRTKDADTSLGSVVGPKLRGTFLLADALLNAGRIDEATRLMENARGTAPKKGMRGPIEWAATSTWLAKAQHVQGHVDAAIGIIEASIPPMGNDRTKVNLEVNRAAMLLEVGRAAEALSAIEAAQDSFAAPGGDGPFTTNARVRGSDRQFAWIKSCALSKLGRTAEAAAAAMPLHAAVEPQENRFVIDPTITLRTTLARCTGNVADAAQAYADALAGEPFGGDALLELQPALVQPSFDPAFMAKVRQHPVLVPLLADRMQRLTGDLVLALNGWRPMPRSKSLTLASADR